MNIQEIMTLKCICYVLKNETLKNKISKERMKDLLVENEVDHIEKGFSLFEFAETNFLEKEWDVLNHLFQRMDDYFAEARDHSMDDEEIVRKIKEKDEFELHDIVEEANQLFGFSPAKVLQ